MNPWFGWLVDRRRSASIPLPLPPFPSSSLSLSLSRALGPDPEISPSIFVKVDPYFGSGWPLAAGRGLARWLYLGPWEPAVTAWWGNRRGHGDAKRSTRARGTRGREGEKARGRIEIRIDSRKSSGTRPTFGYSCERSSSPISLSLSSSLLFPFLFSSFRAYSIPPPIEPL